MFRSVSHGGVGMKQADGGVRRVRIAATSHLRKGLLSHNASFHPGTERGEKEWHYIVRSSTQSENLQDVEEKITLS